MIDSRQIIRMNGSAGAARRHSAVRGKSLLRVIAGGLRVFCLSGHWGEMSIARSSFFTRTSASAGSTVTAVVAYVTGVALVCSCVVIIVFCITVNIIHRRVVIEMPMVPAAAIITVAEVSEAIVDAAVKPYGRAPVTFIKQKAVPARTPITRSPQISSLGRHHPFA